MRLFVTVGIIAAALVAINQGVNSVQAEATRELRVMSYNIHHGRGTDGTLDLTRIANVIRSARPDLVALQEVDRNTERSQGVDQLDHLADATGMHSAYGKSLDFQGGEYGVAVLSRFEITKQSVHPLPRSADHEQRVALEVRVDVPEFMSLGFVCTHFDHQGAMERIPQAEATSKLLRQSPHAVILAGDLNAAPDSDELAILSRTWRMADAEGKRPTLPGSGAGVKIDYVLYPRDARWSVRHVEVLAAPQASDHLPLLAVLAFTPESEE